LSLFSIRREGLRDGEKRRGVLAGPESASQSEKTGATLDFSSRGKPGEKVEKGGEGGREQPVKWNAGNRGPPGRRQRSSSGEQRNREERNDTKGGGTRRRGEGGVGRQ